MTRHLIVFAKRPLPGYAKTRLGAVIGAEQAAGVYARLLYQYLLDLLNADLGSMRIELSLAAPADAPFFIEAFPELIVRSQIEGDLGQRMTDSFARAFAEGAELVVLTGSDIPGLNARVVDTAFDLLVQTPVVLGPALDGGYYLIGMRTPGARLFEGIAWSTPSVLSQTQARIQSEGLSAAYLPELGDVDGREDWIRWKRTIQAGTHHPCLHSRDPLHRTLSSNRSPDS